MRKATKKTCDRLFSEWVRSRGACEWCGRRDMRLECAHINSRRFLITRYDPLNSVCLCSACHRKAHDRPTFFTDWLKEYLGEAIYDELKFTAKNRIKKLDYNEIANQIKHGEGPYADPFRRGRH